jgi:hypothetical protein
MQSAEVSKYECFMTQVNPTVEASKVITRVNTKLTNDLRHERLRLSQSQKILSVYSSLEANKFHTSD